MFLHNQNSLYFMFIHISANMSPFGLKFSQMILHTETSKLMYNWSFLFEVLHKPTLLPSTFNILFLSFFQDWSTRAKSHAQTGWRMSQKFSLLVIKFGVKSSPMGSVAHIILPIYFNLLTTLNCWKAQLKRMHWCSEPDYTQWKRRASHCSW